MPQAVVTKESADYFASHPVGTGPFMFQSWQKGVRLILVRNPRYFHSGKPYVDKLIIDTDVAPSVIALKVEKGEVDGFGSNQELTPADAQQARSDPHYARYLLNTRPVAFYGLSLNVHVAPLDKLALRQAIAMAVNRAHLAKLFGGNALPAYQYYVPADPQFDPTLAQHAVYAYDPQKAQALVTASGYHGQPIRLGYSNTNPGETSLAPGVQQDLKQIGLNVTLRGATDASNGALNAALTGHQLSFAGWSVDFPDAYDFYSGGLSCGANAVGGTAAHYCDPVADSLASRAEGLPLGDARNALLRQAQRRILQSASRVPLVFPKFSEMVSPRVGGFYYQLMFGWQFENYWLKR